MELRYDATLEELTETSVRHLLRNKSGKAYRGRTIFSGAILCGLAVGFSFRNSPPVVLLFLCLLGATLGGAVNFFTYRWSLRRRIRKGIEKEVGDEFPLETIYRIDSKSLHCVCHGVTTSLSLKDLVSVSVDTGYVEISFGARATCLIPLRVFENEEAKQEFLAVFPESSPSES